MLRPDHLRRRVALPRRLRELGRGARARRRRSATGRRRSAAGLPVRADFAEFWRDVRVDGPAAAPQGAGHLRAPPLSRRQARLPRGHAAVLRYCAPRAARYGELAPLARLLDAARGRRAVGRRYGLACGWRTRDDPRRGTRRAHAAADRCARPSRCSPVGGKPLIVWQIEPLARAGFRDLVVNARPPRRR